MSSSFESWSDRNIFVAKRAAEMETQSVANSTWSTTSSRKLPMHRDSTQISDLLNPVRGVRDAQLRAGIKPVDHHRHNRNALKQQSEENKERRLAETRAAVEAAAAAEQRKVRLPVSRISRESESGDFCQAPELQTANRSQRRSSEPPPEPALEKHKNYGRVPSYLRQRQLEMAQAFIEKQRAKEASLIPPGMRLMMDDERQEMLAALDRNKAEVEAQMQALPLRIVTFSQKAYKQGLEDRLQEVVEAIALFSRPKVLIQDDNIPEGP